ncbi:motility associated factor glycosyltransferase family protein [Butyrivibrio sp. AE3006]|uniref:motility associated factor glycosyltransferase family protein n=1 Tax=Butyrivibrio sp. AE3006 TaxID=1280673 RepID=UPI0004243765|nr:6-hydroxymethylpterin diphosphokinase MptE-like protein [Butyrivibrio sp. AE3006]
MGNVVDNTFEKNEELRKVNLTLFKARFDEEIQIDPDEDKKYRMERAENGEPVLYIIGAAGGADLRLNSTYNPSYEAERWAEKQELEHRRTTIALMGFSTGVFLKALMKKLRPDTVFFVTEPIESLFAFVCAYVDMTPFLSEGRINFAITEKQKNHLADDMIHDVATFRPETKGIITPFYSTNEKFEKLCEEIAIMMDSTTNYQKDRGRNALRCRMYSWNHMRNAYLLGDLRDRIPSDIPVIIVSAGPSLAKNVEVLRKVKGHAFILCTDRALLVLEKYGIVPDACISLDAEKSPDYMRVKVAENIPVICSYQLNIGSQKLFNDRRIFYHALAYERSLIGEKVVAQNGLDQGGNVAGGAFTVCEFLGIKTVIFIGQDLAFLDGKHHADGKNDGVPQLDVKEIKGIDGGTVKSNDMWIGFRNFFERQIAMHPEMRVIDATEGGAYIEGTEIMTLEEVSEKVCTGNYDLRKIFDDLPIAETDEEYLETVKREEKWIEDLDMIAGNSEELALLSKQLLRISKYQDITDPKHKKKLNKMDALRSEIYGTLINTLMEEFWIEDLYSIPDYTFMVRNNEEAASVFESALKFFEHFPEDCRSLKKELQEAIDIGKADWEKEKAENA